MDIYTFLTNLLGSHAQLHGGETLWSCPFCHHHKKKLAIKLPEGRWHCWVCEEKGSNLHTLLKKLDAPKAQHQELAQIMGEPITVKVDDKPTDRIFLPKEYEPLWTPPEKKDYEKANALRYLRSRGVTAIDILKYQIGFCREGRYRNRLIFPSHDERGAVNFFSTRTYYDATPPYINPPGLKNKIIFYESQISWNLEICICEGPLDAIAIRKNAIPLLGKTLSEKLRHLILTRQPPKVYIVLDADAIKNSIKIAEDLIKCGVDIYIVRLKETEDPASMGFESVWEAIRKAEKLTFGKLITLKLDTL